MGLRGKLLLPILFGFVGFAIVIHFYWGESLQRDKRASILAQEKVLLKTLEPIINRSLLGGDLATIHNTLNNTLETHKDRWVQVALFNNEGQQLYPLSELTPLDQNNITLTHPLSLNDDAPGTIKLTINITDELQIEKQHIVDFEIFTLMLFAALGLISAIWQNFVIRRPVLRLEEAATELAEGDYTIQLPYDGNDEISNLTAAFNTMGESLLSSKQSLQEAVRIARTNEVRTSTVLNNIADGIITINESAIIESFTPAASDIFGYEEAEVIGKNIMTLIPKELQQGDLKELEHYISTHNPFIIGKRIEVEGQRKNGEIFPLELSINEMPLDDHYLFSGIARDITERKHTAKLKDEFVSTVSHELRTPLTSINGALRLINGGALGEVPDQLKEMLSLASTNSERLLLLINDILDMQKIEAGNIDFNPHAIEVSHFIQQAAEINRGYADQYNVRINIIENSLKCHIDADPDRLMQVMCNLLSNAIKFSPPDSSVDIHIQNNNAAIRICVTDHGAGIPQDFQEKLYDKFTQADSSNTRKPGSTGLGLSISKAIIERHGGEIGFTTEDGVGTCFWFEIPIEEDEFGENEAELPRKVSAR